MSCSAVEFDDTRAGLAVDHVGLKPLAIGEIADQNLFVWSQADPLGQVGCDREASLVVNRCPGDRCAVDLRLEQTDRPGVGRVGRKRMQTGDGTAID